jgi:serine/threonine protein phosphatase 1
MPPRLIAIGDIHGCHASLTALLAALNLKSDDTVVTLGDYVDRGPDSSAVIETLTELVSKCHLVPLIGNHEIMMVKAIESRRSLEFWLQNGGDSTLASYGGRLANMPQHHLVFLHHCVRYFETERQFFVHACYDPEVPLDQQPDELLFWTHIFDFPPAPHTSGKKAFVGHTPQFDFEINDFGHVAIIDTCCVGGGWLTAIEANTGEVWQANELGEVRRSGD